MKKALVFFVALVVFSSIALAVGDKYFIYFKQNPSKEDVDKVSASGALRFTYRDMPVVSAELSEQAKGALLKNKNIERIEPVEVAYIAVRPDGKPSGGKPQPSQVLPWGIAKINTPNAWNVSKGTGVRVAVLDTGVDRNHPDIAANLLWCKSELGAKSCEDKNGHGTHVAGTLLALNNNVGVVGVAYEAKLYAFQVCDTAGYCYSDAMAKGIEDARYGPDGNALTTSDNARVISMSISGPSQFGSAFETQMQNAYSEGIVLVAASGNEGTDVGYPARYAEFIAVGATDSSNNVPWWSNRGSALELVAPGVSVYSTYKGDGYATLSGTSMATPHVSGVVALMFAKNPSLTPAQVRTILHTTATDLGSAGWDAVTGYGLVNALGAVIAS